MMNARALAFLSVVSVGACGGETHVESVSSEAVLKENGLKYNGLKYNGLKYNGLKYNGMKYNGMGLQTINGTVGAALSSVRLEKTTLIGTLMNGTTVSGMGFMGATLVGVLENGTTVKVGMAEIRTTPDPEILHYRLQTWNTKTSSWVDTCEPGEMAVPVAGIWKTNGSKITSSTDFTFACVQSSAIGKCVMMGYKPWSLGSHHQACVRMVRADYCGTGTSYTQEGNVINVFDSKGIQKDDHAAYTNYNWIFDAEWGPNGATCISKAGRPGGQNIPCSMNFFCNSGSTFSSGVLLKNWTAVPDHFESLNTDDGGNVIYYNINGGSSWSFGGLFSF